MPRLVENKKVRHDYEILESFEAGIKLFGHEVKSLRKKNASIKGAYVVIRGDEAYLVGATIPPYQPANTEEGYDPERARQLLLNKSELAELLGREKHKGLTVVPVALYTKGRHIKVEIAVVRGKKTKDKREAMKKRDAERDIRRTLKTEY